MVKQSNKQMTKVIVKIGTDVIKRKRTRRNKKVQPPQPSQNRPQSFGTLAPQNTSLNTFSSNIQSQLDNLLKSQSDLNTIVNKLRSEQIPEENEGQNAQIVSGLNLNSEEPIDYEEIFAEPYKIEIPPEEIIPKLEPKSSSSSSTDRGRSRRKEDQSRDLSEVPNPYQYMMGPPVDPLAGFRIPRGGGRGGGRRGRPPVPETIDPNLTIKK